MRKYTKPHHRAMGATRLKTSAIASTTFNRALREPMPVVTRGRLTKAQGLKT